MTPMEMPPSLGGSVEMMTAMMLPSAVPAVARRARRGDVIGAPGFMGWYLAAWALVGIAVWQLYRPLPTEAAAALVVLAGLYELTPFKRRCRHRCLEQGRSSLSFTANCLGSSAGLMLVLVAIDLMSVPLMCAVAAVALFQKLAPPRIRLDVPVALTIIGAGVAVAAS